MRSSNGELEPSSYRNLFDIDTRHLVLAEPKQKCKVIVLGGGEQSTNYRKIGTINVSVFRLVMLLYCEYNGLYPSNI